MGLLRAQTWVLFFLTLMIVTYKFIHLLRRYCLLMTPSIIVSRTDYDDFIKLFNLVLLHITKWVQPNQLVLNADKRIIIRLT